MRPISIWVHPEITAVSYVTKFNLSTNLTLFRNLPPLRGLVFWGGQCSWGSRPRLIKCRRSAAHRRQIEESESPDRGDDFSKGINLGNQPSAGGAPDVFVCRVPVNRNSALSQAPEARH